MERMKFEKTTERDFTCHVCEERKEAGSPRMILYRRGGYPEYVCTNCLEKGEELIKPSNRFCSCLLCGGLIKFGEKRMNAKNYFNLCPDCWTKVTNKAKQELEVKTKSYSRKFIQIPNRILKEMLSLRESGLTFEKIAQKLGFNIWLVQNRIRRLQDMGYTSEMIPEDGTPVLTVARRRRRQPRVETLPIVTKLATIETVLNKLESNDIETKLNRIEKAFQSIERIDKILQRLEKVGLL